MRPSVSLGGLLQAGRGGGERAGRLLDGVDDGADGVAEFRDRLLDLLAPARARLATNCRCMVLVIAASHMIAWLMSLALAATVAGENQ